MTSEPAAASDDVRAEVHARGVTYRLIVPHAETDQIQGHLHRTGTPYEAAMLEKIADGLPEGALVVDVGANIGNHTMFLACAAQADVVAVEPDPELVAALKESIEAAGVGDRVVVHEVAVGERPGRARLVGRDATNLGTQRVTEDPEGEGIVVEVTTLDLLLGDRPVHVMKIDVEGLEPQVLRGARRILEESRPDLWVECLDEEHFAAVLDVLRPLGYRLADIENATPTMLFVHGTPDSDPERATVARVFQERHRAEGLRQHLGTAQAELGRAEAAAQEAEASASTALEHLTRERDALHRQCESLRKSQRQAEEDFRVLRAWIRDAGEKLWMYEQREREYEAARDLNAEYERDIVEARGEIDGLAQQLQEATDRAARARAREVDLRASRTYRLGKTVGGLATVSGARGFVPALIEIAREGRKKASQ